MLKFVILLLAVQGEAPRPESPVLSALQYLLRHQAADGSWGGRPVDCRCRAPERSADAREAGDIECSSWVLLALSGARYTELSTGGKKVGTALKKGLEWLLSKQDPKGAFDQTHMSTNALACIALTEMSTSTGRRKEEAEKALQWAEKETPQDTLARMRLGMLFQTAKLAELGIAPEAKIADLAAALEKEGSDLAKAGALLLQALTWPQGKKRPEMDFGSATRLSPSAEAINIFCTGSFILDGGERWHKWYADLKKSLEPSQRADPKDCEAGSWDAS